MTAARLGTRRADRGRSARGRIRRPNSDGLRRLAVVAVAVAGLVVVSIVALGHRAGPNWVSASAADGSFTARFPQRPAAGRTPVVDGVEQNTLTWSAGPDDLYLASSRWVGVDDPGAAGRALDEAVAGLGPLEQLSAAPVRGHPARTFHGGSGRSVTAGRLVVIDGVLYSTIVVGPRADSDAAAFADSLHPTR